MTIRKAILIFVPVGALVVGLFAISTVIERKYNRVLTPPLYSIPGATAELHQKLCVADLHSDSLLWGGIFSTAAQPGIWISRDFNRRTCPFKRSQS